MTAAPRFAVVPGTRVREVLAGREKDVVDLVERTYLEHAAGLTIDPPSCFLRFPDRPDDRIIALPASLGGTDGVHGVKWISSFPGNVRSGLPRASGVLVLNDSSTGYPFACLEASVISASRTAASAASAADRLSRGRPRPTRLGIVGAGLIARYVHAYLAATGWRFERIGIHDPSPDSTAGLSTYLVGAREPARIAAYDDLERLVRGSDLVLFATVAGHPHVVDRSWFDHGPVVLHLSLRDLAPEVVLDAVNVVDDVEHCLRAGTSLHLAEQQTGHRDFVAATLADVLVGHWQPPADRTLVFSPFGLGVLDLAVGRFVYDEVARTGRLQDVGGFFDDTRHG